MYVGENMYVTIIEEKEAAYLEVSRVGHDSRRVCREKRIIILSSQKLKEKIEKKVPFSGNRSRNLVF